MALTVILLCLPDSLNCLSSGVAETEIIKQSNPTNKSKPRHSVRKFGLWNYMLVHKKSILVSVFTLVCEVCFYKCFQVF